MNLAIPAFGLIGTAMLGVTASAFYHLGRQRSGMVIAAKNHDIRELESELALKSELLGQSQNDLKEQAKTTQRYMGELQELTSEYKKLVSQNEAVQSLAKPSPVTVQDPRPPFRKRKDKHA